MAWIGADDAIYSRNTGSGLDTTHIAIEIADVGESQHIAFRLYCQKNRGRLPDVEPAGQQIICRTRGDSSRENRGIRCRKAYSQERESQRNQDEQYRHKYA